MNQQDVIDIGAQAIWIAMKIAGPALVAIMITGLVISIFQAATQINEQTLSFIPKIMAMTGALVVAGPWILRTIVFFTKSILQNIGNVTR